MKMFRSFVAAFTEDHQRSLSSVRGIFPQSDMFFSNMCFTGNTLTHISQRSLLISGDFRVKDVIDCSCRIANRMAISDIFNCILFRPSKYCIKFRFYGTCMPQNTLTSTAPSTVHYQQRPVDTYGKRN